MKSCRPIEVAMNSIAQHARPKLNTHSEYLRPQFSRYRTGCGASRASAPTDGSAATSEAVRSAGIGRGTTLSVTPPIYLGITQNRDRDLFRCPAPPQTSTLGVTRREEVRGGHHVPPHRSRDPG